MIFIIKANIVDFINDFKKIVTEILLVMLWHDYFNVDIMGLVAPLDLLIDLWKNRFTRHLFC